jgi:hypothetical protein
MADKKISALTPASTPLAGTEVLPIVQSGATVKVSVENVLTSVQPSGVANSVVYLNGSKVATTGGVLLFDGTNLGVGTTPAYRADVVSPAGAQNIFRAGQSGVSNGLTISSDGANLSYQFDTGNIVIGTSGKGIDFSATPGTGTSELLADYEEGTWTATLTGSTGAPTVPVTVTGYYTKVGRQVIVQFDFQGVSTVGATGGLQVTGLPYAAMASRIYAGSAVGNQAFSALQLIGSTIDVVTLATGANIAAGGAGIFLFCTISYMV